MQVSQSRWYVLQVRPKHEATVAELLRLKGYREYVAWYAADGKKQQPLFPGYVFCHFDPFAGGFAGGGGGVVTVPGVVRLLGNGRIPLPVADEEMESIQRSLDSGLPCEPWAGAQPGQCVRVELGPLRGVQGRIVSLEDGERLIVSVQLLQRSVAVRMERSWVSLAGIPDATNAASRYRSARVA